MKKTVPLSILLVLFACGCETLPEQPPPMISTPAPVPPAVNLGITLDLTRRYDVSCHNGETVKVYNDCRIVGFAGQIISTSEGLASTDGYFDHWLVIELPDGHRVYLPPGVIASLEEIKK